MVDVARDAGVPTKRVIEFVSLADLFEALRSGRVTATVLTSTDLGMATKRFPDLQAGMQVGGSAQIVWGVRKGDRALRSALDGYLEHAKKSGAWSRLVVKYYGQEVLRFLAPR